MGDREAEKEKLDEEAYEASAFEALERDFQEVLQELVGDKSLEQFRIEYEKLHRALKKSHDSEKRLIKKCRELNSEIVSNSVKVQTALRLSQEDQTTIASLKKEIDRAWKMVEASHEKEQRAKETIHNLKMEIANLTKLVDQGAGLSLNQENTVNNLVKQKNELTAQRDQLQAQVAALTKQNQDSQERAQQLLADTMAGESEIQRLKDFLTAKHSEGEREARRKKRLEDELRKLAGSPDDPGSGELGRVNRDVAVLEADLQQSKDAISVLQFSLSKSQTEMQKLLDEVAGKVKEKEAVEAAHEETKRDKADLSSEIEQKRKLLKTTSEEVKRLAQEKDKALKAHENLKRRKMLDDADRKEAEHQRNSCKQEVQSLLREIDQLKKVAQVDAKQIDDLMEERNRLNKNVVKADMKTKQQTEKVKEHEKSAETLEEEVEALTTDVEEARKKVLALEKQREVCGIQLSQANSKYMQAQEELKNRGNKISELKKNLADVKQKLALQKQQYESVRTARNLFSKNLIESQDEIAEMKRKFKIMHHQIEQLKEEIKEKDAALVKAHFEKGQVDKKSQKIKDSLEQVKKRQAALQEQQDTQDAEIKKLQTTIQEAEMERQAQKREYEGVISERDILGTQLIRRNDELALLYEKIKIQQSTLQKGEVAFKERLEEMRTLNIKIASLKRELEIATRQEQSIDDLKREVYQLQRELLQERTKVKALSEELEDPMNVYRWRKLEGSDPTTFEMIQKVKALQKRLIGKTEEAVEKDLLIQEKEKLYGELKTILAGQPGPHVAESVGIYQQQLKETVKQMKAAAAELNMYHAQVADYKDDIERLNATLQDTKRKYFDQKRRDQLQKERSKALTDTG